MSLPHRPAGRTAAVLAVIALLAGCATRDGAGSRAPDGLERTPDAEPRVEPFRVGGPNKPYTVLGVSYAPVTGDRAVRERGGASWYGRKFHGRPTASGETYDMYAMTAAHKTMPLPSYARVRNPANGREIVVRVNDRGPFVAGRVIDLSYVAALKLGVLAGVATVEVERLTHDDIRSGRWRRDAAPQPVPPQPPLPADDAPPARAEAEPGFWLQLGAFRQRDGAADLQRRVQRDAEGLAPRVAVFDDDSTWRVQAGPFASRAEAQAVAERLGALLRLSPVVIERR